MEDSKPTRRDLLASLPAAAAVMTSVAETAISDVPAKPAGQSSADPIFAAIEAHRQAKADYVAKLHTEHSDCDDAYAREREAYELFWDTTPATVAGMAALFRYLQEPRWPQWRDGPVDPELPSTIIELMNEDGPDLTQWARNIELALRRIAVTA